MKNKQLDTEVDRITRLVTHILDENSKKVKQEVAEFIRNYVYATVGTDDSIASEKE